MKKVLNVSLASYWFVKITIEDKIIPLSDIDWMDDHVSHGSWSFFFRGGGFWKLEIELKVAAKVDAIWWDVDYSKFFELVIAPFLTAGEAVLDLQV